MNNLDNFGAEEFTESERRRIRRLLHTYEDSKPFPPHQIRMYNYGLVVAVGYAAFNLASAGPEVLIGLLTAMIGL